MSTYITKNILALVIGLLFGSAGLYYYSTNMEKSLQVSATESTSTSEMENAEETEMLEREAQRNSVETIRSKLNSIAHNNDPQNPPEVVGISDEELSRIPTEEIANIIETTHTYASEQLNEPRFLFALGRAALVHGDEEYAVELLTTAAEHGSSAAYAYLAQATDDIEKSSEYLQLAVTGGFSSASGMLAEVNETIQRENEAIERERVANAPMDFAQFAVPEYVEAFHSGNTGDMARKPVFPLAYVSSVVRILNDPAILYVLPDSQVYRGLLTEIDAGLSLEADRRMVTNRAALNQTTAMGVGSIRGMFEGIANTRRQGGSIQDEMVALTRGMLGEGQGSGDSEGRRGVSLMQIKEMGERDGRLLGMLYGERTEDFRKIYDGMRKFIRQDTR